MRERSEQILRIACMTLAALALLQLVVAIFHASRLVGVKIPAVPTLETNAVATPTAKIKMPVTNAPPVAVAEIPKSVLTNPPVPKMAETNLVSTNALAQTATNNEVVAGTNSIAASAKGNSKKHSSSMAIPDGMVLGGMPGMSGPAPKLPPEIQARVDKIVSSGIFGPVIHPLPMGLLGIAGDTAFLRTADGQTGLVKTGDSLGDVKLLQIGVNRVLVEENGDKKELTIFEGYGSDSLLTNRNEILK